MNKDDDYESQQVVLYVNWVNSSFYEQPELRIESLEELSDGVKLIRLMEILTNGDERRYHKHPFNLLFKNENCHTVIQWLADIGVEVRFITPNSIVLGDHRAIMSLLWAMKRHFSESSKTVLAKNDSQETVVVDRGEYGILKKNYMVAMLHNTYLEREIKRLMELKGGDIKQHQSLNTEIQDGSTDIDVSDDIGINQSSNDTGTNDESDDTGLTDLIHEDLIRKDYSSINIRKSSRTDFKVSKKSVPETSVEFEESSSDLELGTDQKFNWFKSSASHFSERPEYSYDSSEDMSDVDDIADISDEIELKQRCRSLISSEKRLSKKKNFLVEELLIAAQKIEHQNNELKSSKEEIHELKQAIVRLERQLFDTDKKMMRKQQTLLRVIVEKRSLEVKLNRKAVLTLDDYTVNIQSHFRIFNAKKESERIVNRKQKLERLVKKYMAKRKLKKFKGFQYYCNDLVLVETSYLKQLKRLYNEFLLPLRGDDTTISLETLDKIIPFSDFEAIIEFNSSFLEKLESIIPQQNIYTKICSALGAIETVPRVYSKYVSNFDHANTELAKVREMSEKFNEFCCTFEGDGLTVSAYLIMPCQRVPRYYMTYKDILKFAGSDFLEYEQLENMVLLSQDIAHKVNSEKTIEDARHEVKSILDKFLFVGWTPQPNPDRRLYSFLDDVACIINKKKQKYAMALFSDLLIAGKASKTKLMVYGDESLKFQKKISLNASTKIIDIDDHSFELGEKDTIILQFENQPDCKQWFNHICESIEKSKEKQSEEGTTYSAILNIDAFFNSKQFLDLKQEFEDEPKQSKKRKKRAQPRSSRTKSGRSGDKKKSSTLHARPKKRSDIIDDTKRDSSKRKSNDLSSKKKKDSFGISKPLDDFNKKKKRSGEMRETSSLKYISTS